MPRVPTVRKADLDRVLRALTDAGQRAASVVVRPGGEIVITPALTADTSGQQVDDLTAWRTNRAQRAPQRS